MKVGRHWGIVLLGLLSMAAHAQESKPYRWLSIRDTGARCDGISDDTAAFNAALKLARQVFIPPGVCVIRNVDLTANTELYGTGDDSLLRVPKEANWGLSANAGAGGTPDPKDNLRGLWLHDFAMKGAAETDGFYEFRHLLNLNAVSDVRIERMSFLAFQGDGIYLGSSNTPNTERHNRQVVIRQSRFDGINKANRNAISVIDGDGIRIENNEFANTTTDNMPGAVDLEPNRFPFHIINDITIRNNRFKNIGGGNGAVSLYVPPQVEREPSQIRIENNQFDGVRNAAIMLYRHRPATAATTPHQVSVRDNQVSNCGRPFFSYGMKQVAFSGNNFQQCDRAAQIGYTGAGFDNADIQLVNNTFEQSARRDLACLMVFTVDGVEIRQNRFLECAQGGKISMAIGLNVGESRNLSITDNRFTAPNGKMTHALMQDARHRPVPGTHVFENNQIENALRIDYPALNLLDKAPTPAPAATPSPRPVSTVSSKR